MHACMCHELEPHPHCTHRLAVHRSAELEPIVGQHKLERTRASDAQQQQWEWERFLACTYVPHPRCVAVCLAGSQDYPQQHHS